MDSLVHLWSLFDRRGKLRLFSLLAGVLAGGVLEALAVGLILPFIAMLNDPTLIQRYPMVLQVFSNLRLASTREILMASGVGLLGLFVFKNVFLAFITSAQYRFVFNYQSVFSCLLLEKYLKAPWSFHLQRNTAELLRNVATEVSLLFGNVVNPLITLVSELFVSAALIVLLIIVDPVSSVSAFLLLGGASIAFFRVVRKKIARFGEDQQRTRGEMIKWVNQALGGIKETKILGREQFFINIFKTNSDGYSRANHYLNAMGQMPRFFLETLLVGGIVLLSVVTISQGEQTSSMLPKLALFAAAAYRVLPSFTRILNAATNIRYHQSAIDVVYRDLSATTQSHNRDEVDRQSRERTQALCGAIDLRGVSYKYEGAVRNALDDVSLAIPKGEPVGIIGPSGAGKTTIVDIILGLLKPTEGAVLVDGRNTQEELPAWQRQIGYIPQSIYLSDDTLRRNVAFGVPDGEIDESRVVRAISAAQLGDLVANSSDGLDTIVGEHGVRLSGGQRQRIGIARALYNDPEVLVMDEATSSLDHDTEREVTDAIYRLSGKKTLIIISHRRSTTDQCKILFELRDGKLVRTTKQHAAKP